MPISERKEHFLEDRLVYNVSLHLYSRHIDFRLTWLVGPHKYDLFENVHTFRRKDKRYRRSMYLWTKLSARSWSNPGIAVFWSWASMQTSKQSKNNVLEAQWISHLPSSIICYPFGIVRRASKLLVPAPRYKTLLLSMTKNWDRGWLRPCWTLSSSQILLHHRPCHHHQHPFGCDWW